MRPPVRHAALLLAVVGAGLAVPAASSPQPTPVCTFCGPQFEAAAVAPDANVSVAASTAVVKVHDDGSATWTVRNRLDDGAEAFRENPENLERTVRGLEDLRGLPERSTNVTATLEDDTVVVTAEQADVGSGQAGILVVDLLHDRGGDPRYHVNADRFTIRGPPGTVVTNDPEGATVEGRNATWHGTTSGARYAAGRPLRASPYVAFEQEGTFLPGVRTTAALALATLPVVVGAVGRFLLLQTALFALAAATVGRVVGGSTGDDRTDSSGHERPAVGALAVGVVVLVASLAGDPLGVGTGVLLGVVPAVVLVAAGGLALAYPERLGTPVRQAAFAVPVLAVLGLVSWYVAAGTPGEPGGLALRTTAAALPLLAFLPLGGALAVGRRRLLWGAVAVVSFVVAVSILVDLTDPPTGLGGGIVALVLFVVAVVIPLLGSPLAVLGARLADVRSA